jgi:hypothetical protein
MPGVLLGAEPAAHRRGRGLFPELLRTRPDLAPVVADLMQDHHRIVAI